MAGFYESLTLQNYKKAMSGAYTYYGLTPDNLNNLQNNPTSLNGQIENSINKANVALSPVEQNHDDTPTFLEKAQNSASDLVHNVVRGFFNFFDGIGDFFMGTVGTVAGWFGNTDVQKTMESAINYDWQSNAVRAVDVVSPAFVWQYFDPKHYQGGFGSPEEARQWAQDIDDRSLLGGTQVNNFVNTVEQGIGQIIPALATGQIVGGAIGSAMGANTAVQGAGTYASTMGANISAVQRFANIATQAGLGFMQGAGRGYSTAVSEGKHLTNDVMGYATLSGLIQGAEQGLSAGIGGTFSDKARNFLGDNIASKLLSSGHSATFANIAGNAVSIATDVLMDAGIDAVEEAIDPVLKQIYDSNAIANAYGSPEAVKETTERIFSAFLTSAVTSAIVDTAKSFGGERTDYTQRYMEKVSDEIKNDGELSSKIDNLNRIKEEIEIDTKRLENIQEEMKKPVSEERMSALRTEFEEVKADLTEQSKTGQKLSEEVVQGVREKVYSKETLDRANNQAMAELSRNNVDNRAETLRTIENIKKRALTKGQNFSADKFRKVGEYNVRLDEARNALEYQPHNIAETTSAINAIVGTPDIVRVESSDLGLVNKGRIEVIGKTLKTDELLTIRDNISNTIAYNNRTYKNGKEYFIELSNGTTYLINTESRQSKNGKYYDASFIKEVNGKRPDWATEENTLNPSESRYADDHFSLLKKASPDFYIPTTKVDEIFDNFANFAFRKTTLMADGVEFKDTGFSISSKKWKENFEASYALAKNDGERRIITNNAIDTFLDREFRYKYENRTGKLRNYYSDEEIENLKNSFYEFTEAQRKPSENNVDRTLRLRTIEGLQKSLDVLVEHVKANNAIHKQILSIAKKKNSAKAKQAPSMSHPHEQLTPYSQQVFDGITNFDKYGRVAETQGRGFFGALDYTEDTMSIYFDPELKADIDEFKSHYKDVEITDENGGTKTERRYFGEDVTDTDVNDSGAMKKLTFEDETLLASILSRLNKQNSEQWKAEKRNRTKEAIPVVQEVRNAIESGVKFRSLSSSLTGAPFRFREAFGADSTAYKVLCNDVIHAHYNSSSTKYGIVKEMNSLLQYHKIKTSDLQKSISIDDEKFTKAELMQIYLNGLSPDNNDHMLKHGAILKRGDKQIEIKYTEDFSNKVANSLTKEEIDFTYDLFTQGYNGTTKKILNDYSERNYGYSLFNESGYVHRSMTGLNYEASNDGFRQRAGALGSTIAKKRTNNSAPILIKDILTSYDNYASLVADYVSLDPVRKVNRIVNQRDENNKSIMSYFDSDKSGGGGRFIRNWLDTINGINKVRGEGGKISTRLMANAVLTPIEMNVGTMIKMYIDPLRFPATTYNGTQRVLGSDGNYTEVPVSRRVGWGSYITGVVRGFFSRMAPSSVNILDASGNIMYEDGKPVTKKAVDIFKETSSYYIRANEKGSIQNRYYLNNVFSNNMSRVQNFLSKGLEFAQNDMMTHMAFPVMQQFAKNLGYGDINSYENTTKAVELFDTLAMTTLSNGDNLDVSDLRSSNSLVRFLFGVFGGDSQKKVEQFTEAFTGTQKSRRRLESLNSLEKSSDEAIKKLTEQKSKLNDELKQKQDEYVSRYNEKRPTTQIQREINRVQNDIANVEAKIDGYNQTKANINEQRTFEKNYTSGKAVTGRIAGFVSTFIVAVLAEQLANIANDQLKGKDLPEKEEILQDIAYDSTVGWIPVISTIANAVRYNDKVSPLGADGVNQIVNIISSVNGIVNNSNDPTAYRKLLRTTLNAFGSLAGLPIQSVSDYLVGAFKNVDKVSGNYRGEYLSTWFHGYSSSYLNKRTKEYVEKGDLSGAVRETMANMALFKSGATDTTVAREIVLRGVNVSAVPTGYTSAQKDTFSSVYSRVNSVVSKYIRSSKYRMLSDEEKTRELSKLYRSYYLVAKHRVEDTELTTSLSKALYTFLFQNRTLTREQRKLLKEYGIL